MASRSPVAEDATKLTFDHSTVLPVHLRQLLLREERATVLVIDLFGVATDRVWIAGRADVPLQRRRDPVLAVVLAVHGFGLTVSATGG